MVGSAGGTNAPASTMCQAAIIGVTSGLTAPEAILPYLRRALRHSPSATITTLMRLRDWGLSWAQTTAISNMLEAVHSLVEEDCPRLSRLDLGEMESKTRDLIIAIRTQKRIKSPGPGAGHPLEDASRVLRAGSDSP